MSHIPIFRDTVQFACLLALLALMLRAAFTDLRSRRIANGLCIAVAILSLPYWIAADHAIFSRLAIQLALCGAASVVLIVLFGCRMLGGGDVKLIAALMLWLRPEATIAVIVVMSLVGGVLAVVMVILAAIRPDAESPTIPYAVAITIGGLTAFVPQLIALSAHF